MGRRRDWPHRDGDTARNGGPHHPLGSHHVGSVRRVHDRLKIRLQRQFNMFQVYNNCMTKKKSIAASVSDPYSFNPDPAKTSESGSKLFLITAWI